MNSQINILLKKNQTIYLRNKEYLKEAIFAFLVVALNALAGNIVLNLTHYCDNF